MVKIGQNRIRFIDDMQYFLEHLTDVEDRRRSKETGERDFDTLIQMLRRSLRKLLAAQEEISEKDAQIEESRRLIEEERLKSRKLFEQAPEGLIITTPSGVILDANLSAGRMLNVTPDFLRGRPLIVFVHELDRDRYSAVLESPEKGAGNGEWEVRMQPAGEKAVFEAALTVIPQWQDARQKGLCWIIRDISGQKRFEEALLQERERARKYLDVSGAIIVKIRTDEQVEMINRSGCELLGYQQGDVVGRNWFDQFLPERARESVREQFHRFITGDGETWNHEYPVVTRSGKERLMDWRCILIRDDLGQVIGTLSSGQDISRRKETEERLRREKEFSEHLINSSSDGIIAFDMQLRCTAWNRVMEHISGVSKEDVLGKNILEVFPVLQGEEPRRCFTETLSGKNLAFKECPYVLPGTGRPAYIDSEFSPIRDMDGRIIGGLVLVKDVTERKLAEEALRESEAGYRRLSENLENAVQSKVRELQQAESLAAIGQIVSIVAHEVRNPLQNVHMGVDMLRHSLEQEENLEPEKLQILDEIDYGVHQLNEIVMDLLEYSRTVKISCSWWEARVVIHRVLAALSDKLRRINVELKLEHGDRLCFGDPEKIKRVLLNLVENAADAMPGGGRLKIQTRVETSEQEETFIFHVQDTGAGIDRETLPRIQEPFFTTKAQGTGLGLSICKKIIDAHKGELRFASAPGTGTTVEVLLPLQ
ncbi:MAG: PAS domain S-box protein [Candidatus Abyssobacteria bacterium SURF_5]|uniref:histidine kinase n=1 Tax=Abyssobacteria bacterium (strain SURF_5) TaxID=2093360 RepID=A0A3A4NLW6_ABYX5|nr:MAG: PAS domain S-box protein [Candidatus Abyssubacteria bacterium SURF_5]